MTPPPKAQRGERWIVKRGDLYLHGNPIGRRNELSSNLPAQWHASQRSALRFLDRDHAVWSAFNLGGRVLRLTPPREPGHEEREGEG